MPRRHKIARNEDHEREAQRQENLPSEAHKLVVAEARDGRLHPREHEEEEEDLGEEPDPARDPVERRPVERGEPAAEEQDAVQRAPFDLTEAESELVAGYQTEYSSMSFALFWLGEYANVLLMCALNSILFFGGWLPPLDWAPLYWIPGWIWLFAKIFFFFFVFSWVKATVPRFRYDQLMRLGWKVFLPLSLVFVVLISGWLMFWRYGGGV